MVSFLALGDNFGLSGAASVEVDLDFFASYFKFGGTTIDNDANGGAVGFAECADAEELTELGRHLDLIMASRRRTPLELGFFANPTLHPSPGLGRGLNAA